MQTIPTADEIRAYPAFGRVKAAATWNGPVAELALVLFLVAAGYGVYARHMWAIVVAGVISLAGVGVQLYGFRKGREPLLEISEDDKVRAAVWKLAARDVAVRPWRR